jgi:hypothetical protein
MKTLIDKEKAKKVAEETASKTISFTIVMVKIIFVIMVVYTAIITIVIYTSSGLNLNDFLINMATVSVGGFWAFFLGYFGWRMAQTIEESFNRIKRKK